MTKNTGRCINDHPESERSTTFRCWRCTYNEKRRVAYQSSKMYSIFVYGTLKRGCGNHRLLQGEGVTFVREAWLPFARIYGYTLVGGVPFVKLDPECPSSVKGELYSVPLRVLRRLDSLEGHPYSYKRTPVVLLHGESTEVYVWQRDVRHLVELPGGEYRNHQQQEATMR